MPHRPELASPVRTLAQMLAAGRISWAEYRTQRAEKVAAIIRGAQPLTYDKPLVFSDSTAPKEHELSQVLIDLDEIEGTPRARWPAMVAVALLGVVIVVAGWAIWRSLQPPVVASAPVVQMSAAEAVLQRFVAAEEWTVDAFDATLAAWRAEPAADRATARRSATWRRLQQQLRERVNQHEVLATVDATGEAAAQVERLRAFQQGLTAD